MSRLYIPPLGTKLRLTAPWSFVLHREGRCRDVFALAGWDRENTHARDGGRAIRSAHRGSKYLGSVPPITPIGPDGRRQPSIAQYKLDPPLAVDRFDFGEAIEDPRVEYHPGTVVNEQMSWSHDVVRDLPCHIEGFEVVLDAPLPPDTARVTATARVRGAASATVTLPAGRVLGVDRYYIRHGAADFDSVTWRLQAEPAKRGQPKSVSGRFWTKLRDANQMEYEVAVEDQPWWHGVVEELSAGKTIRLAHDVPNVPGPLTVEPFRPRTVLDLADAVWLVYADGVRPRFWLWDRSTPFTDGKRVPGQAFGTPKQFRERELDVARVVGRVVAAEGL